MPEKVTYRIKKSEELKLTKQKLVFQNKEKGKRAAELVIANKELRFQNKEKEKRAAELVIANKELRFQNKEKRKRADELAIANKELVFQNKEKEKQAADLIITIKELEKAEEAIKEKEFFLRESQKAANIGSYKLNFLTGKWQSSDTLDNILGIDKNYNRSINGWLKIVHPDDRKKMNKYYHLEVTGKQISFNKEYRIKRISDKKTKWVCGMGDLIFDDKGKIKEMIGTIQDITERKNAEEKLKASEDKYRSFFNQSADAIFVFDDAGYFLDVNVISSKLLGYTRKEFLNMSIPDALFKEDQAANSTRLDILATGKSLISQRRLKRKDGSAVEVEVHSKKMPEGHYLGVVRDLTERKKAEELLLQSQQNYKNLLENMNDGFMVDDISGKITFVNKRFLDIFGLTEDDINNFVIEDYVAPDYAEMLRDRHNHRIAGEKVPDVFVFEGLSKNGNKIWLEVRVNQTIKDGIITGTQSVISDITERKKAEDALRESENHLHAIIRAEPECVKLLSINNELQEMNPAGLAMIDADDLQQLKGKSILNIIDKPYRSAFKELNQNVFKGKSGKMEFEITGLKGTHRWMETHSVPLRNAEGKIISLLAVTRDITERKKTEEERIRLSSILEATSDFVGIASPDQRIIFLNKAGRKTMGLGEREDLSQSKISDYLSDWANEIALKESIPAALKTGVWAGESALVTKAGVEIPVSQVVTAHKDIHGELQYLSTIMRDISESKKAEEKIRLSEISLKQAQALAHISNWEIDLVQNIHSWSDEFYNIFGLNKADVQPSAELFLSFMHPDDASFAQEKVSESFVSFKDSSFSFRFIDKDGIVRHGYTEWRFEFNKKGKPVRLFGILQDITEQKEAIEEIRKSNERYEFINKATQDTIYEWDYHTKTGQWGEGIIKTFGYSKNKLKYDKNWVKEFVHPEDQERILKNIREHIENGLQNCQNEYRFRCADGSYKHVFDRGLILFDNNKKPYHMIGAMTDMTEKKRLEKELVEQQINQQKLITESTIQAQEKEKNELGIELHDNINQILATVKMYLGIAKSEKSSSEDLVSKSYEYVDEAMNEIRKLSHSLVAPSLGDIGFEESLQELAKDININNELNLQVFIDKSYNQKLTDKNKELMLYRIIQEQLNNIFKYAHAKEAVIKLSTDQDGLYLTVSDDGVGFDPSEKSKGIGLKNISSRVEYYSGVMRILSAPGKGCKLEVYIPH